MDHERLAALVSLVGAGVNSQGDGNRKPVGWMDALKTRIEPQQP